MRKGFYVALILCLAVMLYAGCKERAKPVNAPMSIYRVTYSDSDQDGTVNIGDQIIVVFDRHVTVAANPVASVFELSAGNFGASPSMASTSGHALTITLDTGATLTDDGSGIITSQIRVSATVPFNAIKDATWGTSMTGGGIYKSMEGCLAYAAPRLLSATYTDVAPPGYGVGDTLVLTFTGPVNVNIIPAYWPGLTFVLPVSWDYFGNGATAQKTAADTFTITLGSGLKLNELGSHTIGTYAVDSSSGIDIKINISSGLLTYTTTAGEMNVPPGVVDIQ